MAFDTDVFSEILSGAPEYAERLAALPPDEVCITVVTADEVLRGLLAEVRRSEAGRGSRTLPVAYERIRRAVALLGTWTIQPYSPAADAQFRARQAARLAVRPHDLRIATICVTGRLTLVTRNRRDFERVPGLSAEFWE